MPSLPAGSVKGDTKHSQLPAVQVRVLPLSLLLLRSGDEWLIGKKGYDAGLRAGVGEEPDRPPSYGWKIKNRDTREYESDKTITCRLFVNSPPCCLTVSLSGAAMEAQGQC